MNQIEKDLHKLKMWLAEENLKFERYKEYYANYDNIPEAVKQSAIKIKWIERLISYVEKAKKDTDSDV